MKTTDELEVVILAAQGAEGDLSGLTSTSKVAWWRVIVRFVAFGMSYLTGLWDAKKLELEALAAAVVPGTAAWMAARVKEWQYGYALTVSSTSTSLSGQIAPYYLVGDEAAKLVKYVAVGEGTRPLKIKVAKEVSGELAPLSSAERTSLDSYIKQIKFAGTDHLTISADADLVKTIGTVYYNGQLALADVKTAVETALNEHLKGIYFSGKFNINDYRDACEALVDIVSDFQITSVQIKPDGGSYTTVTREYEANAGYYRHDAVDDLDSGLVYVAT